MFDFGIESVKRYNECAYYGRIWLVEFRDYTSLLVMENSAVDFVEVDGIPMATIEGNFVMEEKPL